MEGYTNIIGSQYDFDDLDIEGRVVDEWKSHPEHHSSAKLKPPKQLDEKTLLSERVKLDNGQQADVYSSFKKNDNVWYTCRLCSDTMVGLSALRLHHDTSKHRTNMSKPVHPRTNFIKLDPKENVNLEPGEPVPPGLEEVIFKSCEIQPKLDAVTHLPLIGLEFLIELTESTLDEGFYYTCLLCDKNGSDRNIIIHFTSIFHYMKYLSIFFPTAARKLHTLPNKKFRKSFGLLVTEIVQDIENKYGRMKPKSEPYSNFFAPERKNELYRAILEGPHAREVDGETFSEKATAEEVERKAKELINSSVKTEKPLEEIIESKPPSGSAFNKNTKISTDKKQLRPRINDSANKSPDVEIVSDNIGQPEERKRSRSRSLSSISTLSSVSSRSNRYRSNSRTRSRPLSHSQRRSHWARSKSRSPGYRYRRNRSRSRSPMYNRSSRHSPSRRYYPRRDSPHRSRTPDYKYAGTDKYGRSRDRNKYDRSDRYQRDRYHNDKDSSRDRQTNEDRLKESKLREEISKVEEIKREKLKFYEKNPEKHPQYPEEWKSFWNKRYNELQRSGVDPSKHDFKPEWISFWTKRMKELFEEDLIQAKTELQNKYNTPENTAASSGYRHDQRKRRISSPGLIDISPPTPDKKDVIADIKNTWKALTGSDIKDGPKRPLSPWEEESKTQEGSTFKRDPKRFSPSHSLSPPNINDKLLEDMPQRKTRTSTLIFVLRKLTVLEQQLGSLAPKVFEMMSQALALEKIQEEASLDLLFEKENSVYLETVREKLIALLCAGVVPRNFVNTARSAIKHIDISLYLNSKRERSIDMETLRSVMGHPPSNPNFISNSFNQPSQSSLESPVVVPGVGQVDKIAIAQQIAAVLVQQGRTDVTESELEHLINAVVGMAEASKHSSNPMTTANFLQQLQAQTQSNPILHVTETVKAQSTQPSVLTHQSSVDVPSLNPSSSGSALKLLQSAYNDSTKIEQNSPNPEHVETTDSEISTEKDLVVALTTFNKLGKEEQEGFIKTIHSTNSEMYKRLSPFLPIHLREFSNSPKRSPICIPLCKEKSAQKLKSQDSGRLTPFSSRSSGANPSVGEGHVTPTVILDDEDDDKKNKPIICEDDSPKYKTDDDDDDYSFEDIYKAAQEKLQKQLVKSSDISNSTKQPETLSADVKDDVPFVKQETTRNITSQNETFNTEKSQFVHQNRTSSNDVFPSNQVVKQQSGSGVASFSNVFQLKDDAPVHMNTNFALQESHQPQSIGFPSINYDERSRHILDGIQFPENREHQYDTLKRDRFDCPSSRPFNSSHNSESLNISMTRDSFEVYSRQETSIPGREPQSLQRTPYPPPSREFNYSIPSVHGRGSSGYNMPNSNPYQMRASNSFNSDFHQIPPMNPNSFVRKTNPGHLRHPFSQYPPY